MMIKFKHFRNVRSKSRDNLIAEIHQKYDTSWDGVSSAISALSDLRDYVIVLYDENMFKGAVSYFLKKNVLNVEVDHIGVIDPEKGYGTLLMREIFNIAKLNNKKTVSLVTNGSSNEFYEKIGMYRINDNKLPAIYEINIY